MENSIPVNLTFSKRHMNVWIEAIDIMKYDISNNPFDKEACDRLFYRQLGKQVAENIRLKRELDDLRKRKMIFLLLIPDLLSVLSSRNAQFVPLLLLTRFSLILLPRLSSGWMVQRLSSGAKKAKSFLSGLVLHCVLRRNCTGQISIRFSEQ